MSQSGVISVHGSGTGVVETLTGNSGGAVSPTGGNINTLGTGSITVVGNPGTSTLTAQLTGLTNHSLLVGAGTATLTNLGVATNGQLPIGSTGADPALATLTAGAGITITNGAGSITIAQTNATTGTGTTIGAVTADLITVSPTDLKSFSTQSIITGYDAVNNEMIGGELLGSGRKVTNVTVVGTPDKTIDADAALAAGTFNLVASGANFIIQATGVAGRTINWSARLNYVTSP